MDGALDARAATRRARWIRAVDILWREIVFRKRLAEGKERRRVERRARSLQKIVRKAFSEYHQIELQRLGEHEAPYRKP